MRFEYFLSLMKNSDFIIGNSSAGVREAPYYGIPTINLGIRQKNRSKFRGIYNLDFNELKITNLIKKFDSKKLRLRPQIEFGKGNADDLFLKVINKKNFWTINKQKQFIDL